MVHFAVDLKCTLPHLGSAPGHATRSILAGEPGRAIISRRLDCLMPSTTRQRLIEAAVKRFYRDGFRNVGLDQILADVGISKTAFYKHFPCKEDLMLAVLDMKNQWLQESLRGMIESRGGPCPLEQLRGLFDVVERIIESDDYQGCIFVNVAMEFPLPHDPAHRAAAEHKKAIEDIVRGLADEAGANDPVALA